MGNLEQHQRGKLNFLNDPIKIKHPSLQITSSNLGTSSLPLAKRLDPLGGLQVLPVFGSVECSHRHPRPWFLNGSRFKVVFAQPRGGAGNVIPFFWGDFKLSLFLFFWGEKNRLPEINSLFSFIDF